MSVPSAVWLTASGGPDYSFRYPAVFTGQNGPNSYITIQANPTWWLNPAGGEGQASVGNMDASQLPIRWFVAQNNEREDSEGPAYEELQVPNLQQVVYDDQLENAVPTLQIQLYNINTAAYGGGPLPFGGNTGAPGGPYTQTVLGDPGYLSFQYGGLNQSIPLNQNQNYVLWGQTRNSWFNLLREGALLRWYFGYGGLVGGGSGGNLPLTQAEAVEAGLVCLNGLFMVDSVQIEAQTGLITLTCRAAGGKLVQDQLLYPPLVPNAFYTSSGIEFYAPTPIKYQAYTGWGAPGEQAPGDPITTQMSKDGFYKSIIAGIVAPDGAGYLLAGTTGRTFGYTGTLFGFGGIAPAGDAGSVKLPAPMAGIALAGGTAVIDGGSGSGYWLCDQLGSVYGFGSVTGPSGNYTNPSIANAALKNNQGYSNALPNTHLSTTDNTVINPVVGFAAFPGGNGYWMCTADGSTYAFYLSNTGSGTAPTAFGKPSLSTTQSVVGFALTPNGAGCFMLIFDTSSNTTSVFATGVDTSGGTLTTHALSGGATETYPGAIASSSTGKGYWIAYNQEIAAKGNVAYAAYGDAEFYTQKTGNWPADLNAPASAILVRPQNDGLWIVCQDGGVFTFGGADFYGSMPNAYTFWFASNYVSPYNTDTYITIPNDPATGQPYAAPNNNAEDPKLLAPDYSQIIRILWLWAGGFYPTNGTYASYSESPPVGWNADNEYTAVAASSPPPLLGLIFDSGAYDAIGPLDSSTFDKLPVLQAMQTIAQAIGFIIRFRYDGGLIFTLPNWFQQGNFLEDNGYVWVPGSGDMVVFGDGGYPVNDVTLTSTDAPLRSNILVSPIDPAIFDNSPAFPNASPVPAGISDTVTNLTAPTGTMSLLHGIQKCQPPGTMVSVVRKAEPKHGTHSNYGRGCRCDLCREGQKAYKRDYRAGQRYPKHYSSGPRQIVDYMPIENIRVGDRLLSCHTNDRGINFLTSNIVTEATSRHYQGELIELTTEDGHVSRYTPNHRCKVYIGDALEGKFAVYLMRKGNQYRIGRVSGRHGVQFGPAARLVHQRADALWVLKVCTTEEEAALAEATIAYRFSIPTLMFPESKPEPHKRHTMDIGEFWEAVADNSSQAKHCLNWFGLLIDRPFIDKNADVYGRRYLSALLTQPACNLLDGMAVVVDESYQYGYEDKRSQSGKRRLTRGHSTRRSTVQRVPYRGQVYSLEVENDHTYFADGILCCNSAMIGVPLQVPVSVGDQNLMAEFQALQCWLAARTTTFNSVYDPRVTPDTQVLVVERVTGNTDVQYVTGVHVEHDLDQGSCIGTYTTQWMGGSSGSWAVGGTIDDVSYDANGNAISSNTFTISQALYAAAQAWKKQNPLLRGQEGLLP